MKHVCVHGHFYQPPRENPWLEAIEPQDSAAPYHDWNARVSAECYEPNTAARILDTDDRIVSIINNYSRMSFNFGPTLLSWLEQERPAVYEAILEADRESARRFGGHGSAIAQAYNHAILPLATREEKARQVRWGVRDFEHRFGRAPEGMWLPETGVDLATLEALADHDIAFTVLAPSQAATAGGRDVSGARIDPTRPYRQSLPSGKSIVLFFYDGPVSRAIAFDGLLHRGEELAKRVVSAAPDSGTHLIHVATDGETYGHHHAHGDMALAYALDAIESRGWAELSNYGWFLERFPPDTDVEIFENSAWSCAHGVERWRSDCGCQTGGPSEWNQAWRAPLRAALDGLRDRAHEAVAALETDTFANPETAKDDYVELILDRSADRARRFLDEHARERMDDARALKLLELERQLQLMYTSCGWFFSELSGIETIQVLRYAGRAVQLAEDLTNESIEPDFLDTLSRARSNRVREGTGRDLYEKYVRPSKISWEMLAAHYAIASFFEVAPASTSIYCYDVSREEYRATDTDDAKLADGRVQLTSRITHASETLSFSVSYRGGHDVTATVRRTSKNGENAEASFGLSSLFGDERRRIVDTLIASTRAEAEASYRKLYDGLSATTRFLTTLDVPTPASLAAAAQIVLDGKLREALSAEVFDRTLVSELIAEVEREGVTVDEEALALTARERLEELAERVLRAPADEEGLRALLESVHVVQHLSFDVELWKVQNLFFRTAEGLSGPPSGTFRELAEVLSVRLPGA